MYQENLVKSLERSARRSDQERIIQGESTKRPEKLTEFLSNDINKQQLIKRLVRVWSNDAFAPKLERKTVIAVGLTKKLDAKKNFDLSSLPLQKCACANMLNESTIKLQSGSEVTFRTQRFCLQQMTMVGLWSTRESNQSGMKGKVYLHN